MNYFCPTLSGGQVEFSLILFHAFSVEVISPSRGQKLVLMEQVNQTKNPCYLKIIPNLSSKEWIMAFQKTQVHKQTEGVSVELKFHGGEGGEIRWTMS